MVGCLASPAPSGRDALPEWGLGLDSGAKHLPPGPFRERAEDLRFWFRWLHNVAPDGLACAPESSYTEPGELYAAFRDVRSACVDASVHDPAKLRALTASELERALWNATSAAQAATRHAFEAFESTPIPGNVTGTEIHAWLVEEVFLAQVLVNQARPNGSTGPEDARDHAIVQILNSGWAQGRAEFISHVLKRMPTPASSCVPSEPMSASQSLDLSEQLHAQLQAKPWGPSAGHVLSMFAARVDDAGKHEWANGTWTYQAAVISLARWTEEAIFALGSDALPSFEEVAPLRSQLRADFRTESEERFLVQLFHPESREDWEGTPDRAALLLTAQHGGWPFQAVKCST